MEPLKLTRIFIILGLMCATLIGQNTLLHILHTNNTNGALENCYCPDHPLGAVEKRVVFVEEFLSENPHTIIVDAGDLFPVTNRDMKDSLIVEAYRLIPYDAILPGDQELVRIPEELNDLLSKTNAPIIGTNIATNSLHEMVSYRVIDRKGIRIAVLGVVHPYALKYYPIDIKENIKLNDPVQSVRSTLEHLKGKADIFIVLTHEGEDLDRNLAKSIDGIDVVIGAHSQSVIREPETVNGALIAQAGKEGYYVGIVTLEWDGETIVSKTGRIVPMTQAMPDDERVMEMIQYYEAHTGHINRRKLQLLEGN